jgi:hypothetical protein
MYQDHDGKLSYIRGIDLIIPAAAIPFRTTPISTGLVETATGFVIQKQI